MLQIDRRCSPIIAAPVLLARPGVFSYDGLMANKTKKVAENSPGRFYVDVTCIDCDLCRETAPGNFVRLDKRKYSYVTRQPNGIAEEAACRAAMDECPVEAIGSDG